MRKILFLLLLCSISRFVIAQGYESIQMPKLLPPSPEAFQLGTYGTVPVGLHTGTVNYNIPLYEIKTNKLSLPISLGYSSSGVKVDLPASRAGTGWVLNAGGVINRTVLDEDDNASPSTPQPSSFTTPSNALKQYLETASGGGDTESDIYTFSFNGYAGSFIIKRSGQVLTIPYQPNLKIQSDIAASGGWHFSITTPDGIKYYFGGDGATEKSKTQNGGAGCSYSNYPWVDNAWYLKRIVHPHGEAIDLKYNSVYFSYVPSFSQSIEKLYPQTQGSYVCSQSTLSPPQDQHRNCYSTITNQGRILSEITFANGTVKFKNASRFDMPGDSCLAMIEIYQKDKAAPIKKYELVKTFAGTNSNFTNSIISDNGGSQRLFLTGLKEHGYLSSVASKVYTFEYNDMTGLPPRLSMAQDHFGFFNGATNQYFVPLTSAYSNLFNYFGGNRAPNAQYAQKGMLTKIIYPTGGYNSIEYEQHKVLASNVNYNYEGQTPINGHLEVGGVRVSKITSHDPIALKTEVKKYFYGTLNSLETSTGGLVWSPIYLTDKVVRKNCTTSQTTLDCGFKDFFMKVLSSNSLYPIYSANNGNVVYHEVVESLGENFENGGIAHQFTNYTDAPAQVINGNYIGSARASNFGLYSGQEINTLYFSKSGTTITKSKEVKNHYKSLNDNVSMQSGVFIIDTGIVVNKKGERNCSPSYMDAEDLEYYDINRYYTFSYFNFLDTAKVLDYDASGVNSLVNTTTYKYDNLYNLQKTSEHSTNSKGESISSHYKYPYDFKSAGNIYQKMVDSNFVNPVVELTQKNGTSILHTVKTNYVDWFSNNKILVPGTVDYTYRNGSPQTRLRYHSYSAEGDLLTVSKENDVMEAYYWNQNKQYPIAQAIGARGSEIFFDSYEELGSWSGVVYDNTKTHTGKFSGKIVNTTGGEVTYHSNKWLDIALTTDTKFKYSGWVYSTGPSVELFLFMNKSTPPPNGYFEHVHSTATSQTGSWVFVEGEVRVPQYITRLNIRIDNNSAGTVWFDDIRLHPSSAQMVTYTYDPLIGMTSQTDINNQSTFFEYDAYGRLFVARDHDKNVVKKYCYNYAGQVENCTSVCENTNAFWENTTTAIRCKVVNGVYTGEQEQEQKDVNPCSPTINNLRWTVVSTNCATCPKPQNWQATGNYRCVKDGNNNNTGYQEKEERNMESCSNNYYTTRWVANGYNTSSCPLPTSCTFSTCGSMGRQYKCVNGICEEGYKVYTDSYYDDYRGYVCVYHYEWSDASWSHDYEEYSSGGYPCFIF